MFQYDENISHKLLITYIRAKGWLLDKEYADDRVIYYKGTSYIHIPIYQYSDYNKSIYRALKEIAEVEETNIDSLIEEVRYVYFDKKYIRIPSKSLIDNNYAIFEKIIHCLSYFRQSLIYSAASVVFPRYYYVGQLSNEVKEFSANTFIGTTQKGSLVFPVYTKITPSANDSLGDYDFKRLATIKFNNACTRLFSSLNTANLDSLISDDSRQNGISANFIDGFINTLEKSNFEEIEITSKLSILSIDKNEDNKLFKVNHSDIELMKSASKSLKDKPETKDVIMLCDVKKLINDSVNGKTIELRAMFDKKMHTIVIDEPDESIIASSTEAYKNDKYIKCEGIIDKIGRHYRLTKIKDFLLQDRVDDEISSVL